MEANLYHKFKGQDLNKDLDLEQKIQQISAFVKQSLLSKNIAIFIGSGCSVPEIPLMSITMREILKDEEILNIVKRFLGGEKIDLFLSFLKDKLDKENKEITELFSQLKNEQYTLINEIPIQYAKYLEEFYTNYSDIESLLNWLQNGITFNPNDKDLVEAFNKIKSKFIATIPTQQSQKYNSEVFKIYTQFYDSIFKSRSIESPKVSIFTTNYDLFNEKALEANNIIYTTGFTSGLTKKFNINQFKYRKVDDTDRYKDRWQPVSHEANLYKIHGSINWKTLSGGELYQVEDNSDTQSVVIYPTMLKHRETAQAPYSELFREFSNTLQRKNTTLIVIGYGFPDEHINTIISQNLKNQDFTLIVFGDITENNMENFYREHENLNIHLIGGEFNETQKGHFFKVIVENFLSYIPKPKQQEEDDGD